jgi:hypothetical protein
VSPLSWYSRWDGSQRLDDLDADQLLDAMSDDLLSDGDPWSALRRLFQRGAKNPDGANLPGLQDLLNGCGGSASSSSIATISPRCSTTSSRSSTIS